MSNILTASGRFISVTFAQPHFRKCLYAKPEYGWSIRTETFGEGFHFFFYVMTRGHPLSDDDAKLWRNSLERQSACQPPVTFLDDRDHDDGYLNSIEM